MPSTIKANKVPTHAEKRVLPHTPQQLFDLVADMERYSEFLPWCLAVRIKSREENKLVAEIIIGFKMFRERFSSCDVLSPPDQDHGGAGRIDVTYEEGPFRYLNNHWIFEPHEKGCLLYFFIDFEFRSAVMKRLMGGLFNEAAGHMVTAFEMRARELYGVNRGREKGA
jgi:coenzyme Q-binding protein COQ10